MQDQLKTFRDVWLRKYERGWTAHTERQLMLRINAKVKEFDKTFLQDIMKGIKGQLRKVADNVY